MQTLFRKLGANVSLKSGEDSVAKEESEVHLSKRFVLKSLHSNPSIIGYVEQSLFALGKPQTFGATFDAMNVEQNGKVSWLEFRAFALMLNIKDENSIAADAQDELKRNGLKSKALLPCQLLHRNRISYPQDKLK